MPKRPDGIFHGVCSWSLLRARECLKHLGELADQHQFGFLPGRKDSAGLLGNQHSEERCGWVTDIQKAFENIAREPIRWNPKTNCHLSPRLLGQTARYFLLNGNAGNSFAEQYSSGYPEGCAMSCFAMDLADLVFHLCMRACSQMTTPIAYVDNIELMAHNMVHLQHGILCTEDWSSMWHLSLDRAKSFAWATSAPLRKESQSPGWDLKGKCCGFGGNYGLWKAPPHHGCFGQTQ